MFRGLLVSIASITENGSKRIRSPLCGWGRPHSTGIILLSSQIKRLILVGTDVRMIIIYFSFCRLSCLDNTKLMQAAVENFEFMQCVYVRELEELKGLV